MAVNLPLPVAADLQPVAGIELGHAEAGVRIVSDARPIAYVEAGRDAAVVVSTGMLRALQPGERRAMLAHEAAHLRHRHPGPYTCPRCCCRHCRRGLRLH